jgi:glycerate dehydrogenase
VKIVVLDGATVDPGDNPFDDLGRFGELVVYPRTPPEAVEERARDADIVLTNKTPLSAQVLARLPKLRFVSVLATGYDVVDVKAARSRGVLVANVPEYGTESVAEHTMALLLELARRIGEHHQAVRQGEWSRSPDFCFWRRAPEDLAGRTLGIVGFGRIGRRVAEIARAFGMRIVAASRSRRETPPWQDFAWRDVDRLFQEADVVSLHCPAIVETVGLVDRRRLRSMRSTAFLVNTARGRLVEETSLVEALESGWIAGAALDVVAVEPLPEDSPLLRAPNLILTPHMAWGSLAARRRLVAETVRNVAAFLAGSPVNLVTTTEEA